MRRVVPVGGGSNWGRWTCLTLCPWFCGDDQSVRGNDFNSCMNSMVVVIVSSDQLKIPAFVQVEIHSAFGVRAVQLCEFGSHSIDSPQLALLSGTDQQKAPPGEKAETKPNTGKGDGTWPVEAIGRYCQKSSSNEHHETESDSGNCTAWDCLGRLHFDTAVDIVNHTLKLRSRNYKVARNDGGEVLRGKQPSVGLTFYSPAKWHADSTRHDSPQAK